MKIKVKVINIAGVVTEEIKELSKISPVEFYKYIMNTLIDNLYGKIEITEEE